MSLILAVQQKLASENIAVRTVSMPSWELFECQSQHYRDSVLPPTVSKRLVVEAGVRQGWDRYMGDHGVMIGMEDFGASAPAPILMEKFGFTVENVYKKALELLKK